MMKKIIVLLVVCFVCSAMQYANGYVSYVSDPVADKISGNADTESQSLGLRNFQTENPFNIWFNPAQITVWQTVYGEVWGGAPQSLWGGIDTKSKLGYFGFFVGRPYMGSANGFGDNADLGTVNVQGLNWYDTSGPGNAGITGSPITADLTPVGITNNNIDLLYGFELGPNMALGARLSMASNISDQNYAYSNPDDTSGTPSAGDGAETLKQESSDMELSAGLLMKDLGPFFKFDAAITMSQPKVNDTFVLSRIHANGATATRTASDKLTSNNSMNMDLVARGIMTAFEDNYPLLLTFGYQNIDVSANREYVADNDPTTAGDNVHSSVSYNDKTTNMLLDAAVHTKPADNFKVIYAVGYRTSSRTNTVLQTDLDLNQAGATAIGPLAWQQEKTDSMSLPLSIAVEHQTWSKVCTRMGLNKSIISNTKVTGSANNYRDAVADTENTRDTIDTVISGDANTVPTAQTATVTLGLGITPMKDFSIDLSLLSDVATITTMIARGSIRYHF